MTLSKADVSSDSLLNAAWLDALEETHEQNQQTGMATALGCILLDRWKELRQRFGYRHLFNLRQQLTELCREQLGQAVEIDSLNEAGIMLRWSASNDPETQARALFERLSMHEFRVGEESIALTASMSMGLLDGEATDLDAAAVAVVSRAETLRADGCSPCATTASGSCFSRCCRHPVKMSRAFRCCPACAIPRVA
jgi:hypothetical protein